MTSNKRYAPDLTTGPTTPIGMRIIHDRNSYRCEVRECGRFVVGADGDFLEADKKDLGTKVAKLSSVIKDYIHNVVAQGSEDLEDYTINVSIQPVLTIRGNNITVHAEDSHIQKTQKGKKSSE